MLTVALTGGIGCGKTTVCQLFAEFGTPIIDTDIIARELVTPGKPTLKEITKYFGEMILFADGSLNRQALANITFNNEQKRKHLESILHPKIRQSVKQQIDSLSAAYVIIAIPLLIETSQQNAYDRVLVVDCDQQQQIRRTQNRDQRSNQQIRKIIDLQVSREKRLSYADDVIKNDEDIDSLKLQVNNLHNLYTNLTIS